MIKDRLGQDDDDNQRIVPLLSSRSLSSCDQQGPNDSEWPSSSHVPLLIAPSALSLFAEKKPTRNTHHVRTPENSFSYAKLSNDYNSFSYPNSYELDSMQTVASVCDLVLAPGRVWSISNSPRPNPVTTNNGKQSRLKKERTPKKGKD